MKLRPSLWMVPIVGAFGAAVTLVFGLVDSVQDGDDLSAVPDLAALLEILAVLGIAGGVFALITLACLAIPFAKVDERGYWEVRQGAGMQLTRPLERGERFVASDRRLFVLRPDGEYERLRLFRWTLSKRTWAKLEERYPSAQSEKAGPVG
ncbi:hypothetical protein [Glycomyces sp. NPDC048151]|uniref:hypothetical protein n=1 Tax=Glycomyces sp. NPDC048151 TaxID=3364002 RepID=UPI003718D4D0